MAGQLLASTAACVRPPPDAKGTIYVWREGSWRVAVFAPRCALAAYGFHITFPNRDDFLFFHASEEGGGQELMSLATAPFEAAGGFTIAAVSKEAHEHIARVSSAGAVQAWPDVSWRIVAGAPAAPLAEEGAMSQAFVDALLANFRALKNDWPRTRAPAIGLGENTAPLPDLSHRKRIQGEGAVADGDGKGFLAGGAADMSLVLSIAEVYGQALNGETAVLDWGVGCGRMARHAPEALRAHFQGIDVDPINIEWCRKHMTFGAYEAVDPYSPTRFADKSFDLIYAHSVLTHLSETDQARWLRELARISRGLLILSVHGVYSGGVVASWARIGKDLGRWIEYGFRDSAQPNPDIQDVTDKEYYRDVAHTPAYIRKVWSGSLDILDIIPGGFGAVHDAVVCRPRTSP